MSFRAADLEKKKKELQEKIAHCKTQQEIVKNAIQKLTARYNIGEIRFDDYQKEYGRIFKDKSPEQWINYYNIQLKSYNAQLVWYESEIKKAKKEKIPSEKNSLEKGIVERVHKAEQYKSSVVAYVSDLTRKYNEGTINRAQYRAELQKKYGQKTPQQIVDYYDRYIQKVQTAVPTYTSKQPRVLPKKVLIFAPLLLLFFFVIYGVVFLVSDSEITGFSVQTVDEVHTKNLDLVLNESGIYDFDLPQEGVLNWIKLNGDIEGEGRVRIYLDDVLLLDSTDLDEEDNSGITGNVITGFATEGEETSDSDESSDSSDVNSESQGGGEASEPASQSEDISDSGEDAPPEAHTNEETSEEPPAENSEENVPPTEEPPPSETNATDNSETEENATQEEIPQDGIPAENIRRVLFENYCKESCDLHAYNLSKDSYSLRIEIEDAVLSLDELEYEIAVAETVAEENVTITGPPVLIDDIPNVLIEKNSYYDLHVSDYFEGAVEYYLRQTDNLTTTVFGDVVRIEPEENFTGERIGRIVVVNDFGDIGSNEFNISVVDSGNLSEILNETLPAENASVNVTTHQYQAIINRPVKWIKTIELDNLTAAENLILHIPRESENISIKTGEEAENALAELGDYEETIQDADREDILSGSITGNVARDVRAHKGIFTRFFEWLFGFTITGRAISEDDIDGGITESRDGKLIDVGDIVAQTHDQTIAVEYYTDAPTAVEEDLGSGKRIVVSGPDQLNYTDILAYTVLENKVSVRDISRITLFWHASYEDAVSQGYINATALSVEQTGEGNETIDENSSDSLTFEIPFHFDYYDLDNDGNVDYIEWIVPHLSNQTFELYIQITKAEHLNETRELVSDIYENVYQLDGNWSEPIPENHFVRVSFERNLTSQKDITLYPRTVNGTPRIEVYEIGGTDVIAQFDSLTDNQYNKVLLTNLGGSQDSFDLKILGGWVEFDHIIDPPDTTLPNVSFVDPTPTHGTSQNGTSIYVNVSSADDSGTHYVLTDFDRSLVLWYRFDNSSSIGEHSSNISDSSGNSLNVTGIFGNAAPTTNGRFGGGWIFDGTGDALEVVDGTGSALDTATGAGQARTWAYWLNFSSCNNCLLTDKDSGFGGFHFASETQTGPDTIHGGVEGSHTLVSPTLTSGKWYHVAFTYNGTHTRMYINGTLVDGPDAETAPADDNDEVELMGDFNTFNTPGTLDEFMIFNRSLTDAEIASLYNATANQYTNNFTGLSIGNHTITSYAVDSSGNRNKTETRNISVIDSPPTIAFADPTPANVSSQTGTSIFVNATSADNSQHYVVTKFDNDIKLWYRFDNASSVGENATFVYDWSGNNNSGMPVGSAAVNSTIPIIYQYYEFPTGANINVSYNESLNVIDGSTPKFSMFAWIKVPSLANRVILSQEDGGGVGRTWLSVNATGGLTTNLNGSVSTLSTGLITSARWYHVGMTYNGTTFIGYVDGVERNSVLRNVNIDEGASGKFRFGSSKTGTNTFSGGSMDEIIIFNRTLNLSEIKSLYNASVTKYEWNFSGLASGTHTFTSYAVDRVGNRNQTDTRSVTIVATDTSAPVLNFTSPTPANASTQNTNHIFVNVSSSDNSGDHYTFVDFDRNLLLWLRMDDTNSTNGTIDLSSYSRNGTLHSTVSKETNVVSGLFGKAIDFDSGTSDYINVSSMYVNEFSVSMWVRSSGFDANDPFIGDYDASGADEGWALRVTNCIGGTDDITFSAGTNCGAITECVDTNLDDGNWHYIGMSRNGTTIEWFIDGTTEYDDYGGSSCTITSSQYPLRLGASQTGSALLDAYMDEVLIFNRTLSGSEFASLYNATANQYTNNFTGLSDGAHTIKAYSNDKQANYNFTLRTISTESSVPSIDFLFDTPDNNSYINESFYTISINASDSNDIYSFPNVGRDLSLWLRMDDVNSTGDPLDLSGYNNNGSKKGNAVQNTSGYWGKSFSFDGNGDYIVARQSSVTNFRSDGNYTWSMWAKGDGGLFNIGTDTGTDNSGIGLIVSATSDHIIIADEVELGGYYKDTGITLDPSTWYHYVLTKAGDNLTLYINANVNASTTDFGFGTANTNLEIGRVFDNVIVIDYRYFSGSIDEFLMFNRSFEPEEVRSLYNASAYKYSHNFTNTVHGQRYSFLANAVDVAGNRNATLERFFIVDKVAGNVTFVTPVNNTFVEENFVYVNVTTTDATSGTFSFLDFDRSLLLWYDMDTINGSGDPTDLSTYSRNGTKVGDGRRIATGYFGEGFQSYGKGDYVKAPTISNVNISGDGFTQSLWVKFPTLPATSQTDAYTHFFADANNYVDFAVAESSGTYTLMVVGELNDHGFSANYTGLSSSTVLGRWHHVLTALNSTNVTLYVDGVQVNTSSQFGSQDNYAFSVIRFGINLNTSIDEVMLFNRTLTDAEAKSLYNSTANRLQTNLTNLVGQRHSIVAYTVDRGGNKNSTRVDISNDLSSCRTIHYPGAYSLVGDLTFEDSDGVCLNITTSNVTIDGAGYSINGPGAVGGSNVIGIQAVSVTNVTLKNFVSISGFGTAEVFDTENGIAVSFDRVNNSILYNFSITANGEGIGLTNSYVNNITSVSTSADAGGLSLTDSAHNIITSITLDTESELSIAGASTNNTFVNSLINNPTGHAISLYHTSKDNVFQNVTIRGTVAGKRDLLFNTAGINGTTFVDMPGIGNYSFTGSGGTVIVRKTGVGEVRFLQVVNGSGNNFTRDIFLAHNLSEVRSDLNRGLNRSANVTFYGLYTSFTGPAILRNGAQCTTCFNFTSLNAGTVVFNVTAWTNYSIGEIANQAPIITTVDAVGTQTPVENSNKTITASFYVYDGNGNTNINQSTWYVNFSRGSEPTRQGSCVYEDTIDDNTLQATCYVQMFYFDDAGTWNVTAYVQDNAGAAGTNSSTSFTYSSLSAIVISPPTLTFTSAGTGQTNVTGAQSLINNTGNYNATNISITGYNLFGQTNGSILLSVRNFTVDVDNSTGAAPLQCSGDDWLSNATRVNVTRAVLNRGNHSVNNGTQGQEVLYYCIPQVPYLRTQTYTTTHPSSGISFEWTIRIALVAFARKRKRKKDSDIIDLEKKPSLGEDNLLEVLDKKLSDTYGVGLDELLVTIQKTKIEERKKVRIPLDVFSQDIGVAEAVCTYLKENKGMSYSEIAKILNRDPRTVWINYSNARKKSTAPIIAKAQLLVPASILADRRLSILESVVYHLREKGLKNAAVAELLGKDPRNVWTLYSRAVRKLRA